MNPQNTDQWLPFVGFESTHEISESGLVRKISGYGSAKPGPRSVYITPKGYKEIVLYRDGIPHSQRIQRAVAEAFIGPCPEGMECAHIDGNPSNCHFTNLKWATHKENINDKVAHGTNLFGEKCIQSQIDNGDVVRIFEMRSQGISCHEIGKEFGLHPCYVRLILTGKRWAHLKNKMKGFVFDRLPRIPDGRKPCERIINESIVHKIDKLRSEGLTLAKIGERFGIKESAVSHVCLRRTWKHVPKLTAA